MPPPRREPHDGARICSDAVARKPDFWTGPALACADDEPVLARDARTIKQRPLGNAVI